MTERREEDQHRVRRFAFAVGVYAVGAVTGLGLTVAAVSARYLLVPPEPEVIEVESRPVKFCQPFQTAAVREANEYYLGRSGYVVVLAQDLAKAFKERSAGRVDLLQQTRELCFTHLGAEGYAVNQYWMKTLKKR